MGAIRTQLSKKKEKQYFSEMLIYFLQHGYLPAWSDITCKKEFIENLMEWARKDISLATKKRLIKVLHVEAAQQRIIHHLSDVFFYLFIEEIFPYSYELIITFQKDMEQLVQHKSDADKKEIAELFKTILLQHMEIGDSVTAASKVASYFVEQLYSKGYYSITALRKLRLSSDVLSKEVRDFVAARKHLLNDHPHTPVAEQQHLPGTDAERSFHISNAGLVLIAPFLSPLFKRLNMLKTDGLVDKEAAACVIHYLLTGKEDVAEFELVFPKVLVGADLPEPVNVQLPLNKAQKVEANELLLSVIDYWGILKNTSMDGLRGSFLQRGGMLSFKKNQWVLRVEQRPFDMLLQQLPWNIQTIQLPWMKHMIKTEWVC